MRSLLESRYRRCGKRMIRSIWRWSSGLVVLVLGLAGQANAELPEWRTVTPQELAMTSEAKVPGAPAIILYMRVDRDDAVGREDRYIQVKVLTNDGRSSGDIEISYDQKRERVSDIEARTIRKDGTIVPFKGEIFEKPIASGSDRKAMMKTLALTDVEVGGIVEYRFTRRNRSGLYNTRWVLNNRLFTREAHYSFNGSSPFRYSTLRGLPPGTPPITGKRGHVDLHTYDVAPVVEEDFSPPEEQTHYTMNFIYAWDWDRPAKDPEKFWSRYADEQRQQTEGYLLHSKSLTAAVQELAPTSDSPEVRLRKLYQACAKLRNRSYEPERTAEEFDRDDEDDPSNAGEVWKRQYGWAGQINLLFMAMARKAGFEVAEVWVANRSDTFFDPKQMDPGPLDSRLIAVKLDGKELFLSPGTRYLQFGMLPWGLTAVRGLRIDEETYSWVDTPALTPNQTRSLRVARLLLSPDGELSGQVTVTHTGQHALWRRNRENNEDASHRRKFLEDDLIGTLDGSAIVKVTRQPDWDGTGDFVVEYDLKIPGHVQQAGNRRLFPLALFPGNDSKQFQQAGRVHPVYFWHPYETEEDVEIELPSGWKLGELPGGDFRDLKRMMYSIQALKLGGQNAAVRVRRTFRLNLLMVMPDAYPQIQQFYEGVRSGDGQQVVVVGSGS